MWVLFFGGPRTRLEQQFEAELDLPRGGGGGDDAGGGADGLGRGLRGREWRSRRGNCLCILGWAGGEDRLRRREQVGVVEDVEEFRTELYSQALVDLRGFGKGKVEVVVAGPGQGVAAEVANRAEGRCGEGGRVEVLGDPLCGGPVGVE